MYVFRLLFWTQICFSPYFSSHKEFFELNCSHVYIIYIYIYYGKIQNYHFWPAWPVITASRQVIHYLPSYYWSQKQSPNAITDPCGSSTTKRGVSVSSHFFALISCCRLLSQNREVCLSQRSRKRLFFHRKIFKFFKYLNLIALFAILEFEIVYEDTCRQRILSDTRLVNLR